jgi:hypothetical protein
VSPGSRVRGHVNGEQSDILKISANWKDMISNKIKKADGVSNLINSDSVLDVESDEGRGYEQLEQTQVINMVHGR